VFVYTFFKPRNNWSFHI